MKADRGSRGRTWIILIAVLLLVGGGGYVAYASYYAPTLGAAEEPPEPELATATVTRGDIVLTADGSGELLPGRELKLAFRASGVLEEVLVEVGDKVQEGDLVARLKTDSLERAVAEAEVDLQIAEIELESAQEGPTEAEFADAEAALRDAQVELTLAYDAYNQTFDSRMDGVVESAKVQYDWWVGYYQHQKAEYEEGHISHADHDWAMAAMIEADGRWQSAINDAQTEEVQSGTRVEQAQNDLYQAERDLELLHSEPLTDTVVRAMLEVDQALMALEKARVELGAAHLYAPINGTVIEVLATPGEVATLGEQVGTSTTILTLANLAEPVIRFWVVESDYGSVIAGNRVGIVFEAFPDESFAGQVVSVDPMMVTVDGTPAVQAWASLDLGDQAPDFFSGMTAEIEITAAEARGVLLVPVEALRETVPGQYSVFVVGPDDQVELRAVAVGLRDFVSAEITDGLELGETVSLGEAS